MFLKKALTVLTLVITALPVKAEEKVWLCEMTGHAVTSLDGSEQFDPGSFAMKVNTETVRFEASGYFYDIELRITEYEKPETFVAQNESAILRLDDGVLGFALTNEFLPHLVNAITAKCRAF